MTVFIGIKKQFHYLQKYLLRIEILILIMYCLADRQIDV